VVAADLTAGTVLVARVPGVLAGLPAVKLVIEAVEPALRLEPHRADGDRLDAGTSIGKLSGPMRGILAAERTALNFLQHLSGIATLTRRYVDAVAGLPCKILDTRKTIPGWRLLAKYAVRCGGGANHRLGLHDGTLIKDNHLAAMAGDPLPRIQQACRDARLHGDPPVEIEVETLADFKKVLACKPHIILLDNMAAHEMREAVAQRSREAPEVLLEASGGVTLETVRGIAETGVDRISVGALTHSAPALDIALDYATPRG
jgi:nicotinate-nucleotide pyrophosphorylase (carboxylating)